MTNKIYVVSKEFDSEDLYVDDLDDLNYTFEEWDLNDPDHVSYFEVKKEFAFKGLDEVLDVLVDHFDLEEVQELLNKMQTIMFMRSLDKGDENEICN